MNIKNAAFQLSLFVSVVLFSNSCTSPVPLSFGGDLGNGMRFDGFEFLETRFESEGNTGAENHWLAPGEKINAKWDAATILVGDTNTTDVCQPYAVNLPQSCRRCAFAKVPGITIPLCIDIGLTNIAVYFHSEFDIVSFRGHMFASETLSKEKVNGANLKRDDIEPTEDSNYAIPDINNYDSSVPADDFLRRKVLAKSNVFLVPKRSKTVARYELKRFSDTSKYLKWTARKTGQANEIWSDNFSSALRITSIRILKGFAETDPNTGLVNVQNPAFDPFPVRILYVPFETVGRNTLNDPTYGVYESQQCLPYATAQDGYFFNMVIDANDPFNPHGCRYVNSQGDTVNRSVDVTPSHTKPRSTSLAPLMWLVEYPNSGLLTLADGEKFVIEFTIEHP